MRLVISISAALLLSACGSTQKSAKTSGLNFVPYKTVSSDRKTDKSSCPNSTKSWSKSNNKTILGLANSCIKAQDWKMLGSLGEHLAIELPNEPWGAYYMSLAAEGKGQMQRALWMAQLTVKKAPNLSMLHYHKGRIEWAIGDGNTAIESMKEALRLDSKFEDANFFLANIHYQDQNYKESKSYFEKVIKSNSGHSKALIGLGESHYRLGDKEKAKKYYELAIDTAPTNLGLRLKLADLYELNKDYEQALYHYKKAKQYDSRGPASTRLNDLSLKIRELEKQVDKSDKQKVSKTKSSPKKGA